MVWPSSPTPLIVKNTPRLARVGILLSLLFPSSPLEIQLPQRVAVHLRIIQRVLMAMVLAPIVTAQTSQHVPTATPGSYGAEVGMPVIETHAAKAFSQAGQIWSIRQGLNGVIYFGVSAGTVVAYDGVSFRKIETGMDIARSLAIDDSGRIWVGGNGGFGYLAPDANGTLKYISLLDKVPANARSFTDVWQTLVTPQGTFFRSYELLFRWDGKNMQVWRSPAHSRFEALAYVRGHIYTAQSGIGLEEVVGDELRRLPGGDAYSNAAKLYLHPYDNHQILVSQRDGLFSLYDGQKVTPFPTQADDYLKKNKVYKSILLKDGKICATTLTGGAVILDHDGKLSQIIDVPDGLIDSDVLSAYEDRDGALWLGSTFGISRVEISSPISIFSRPGGLNATLFQGSVYISKGDGSVPLEKLVFNPQTHRPTVQPIGSAVQGFDAKVFKDPSGKTPDQLLAATGEGVMRLVGNISGSGRTVPSRVHPAGLHGLPVSEDSRPCLSWSFRRCGFNALGWPQVDR